LDRPSCQQIGSSVVVSAIVADMLVVGSESDVSLVVGPSPDSDVSVSVSDVDVTLTPSSPQAATAAMNKMVAREKLIRVFMGFGDAVAGAS